MKKVVFVILSSFLLQSCQYFEKNVPKKEVLLEEEFQKIDWSEVDEFPTTKECDSIKNKDGNKQCFFEYMSKTIKEKLLSDSINVIYPKLDTIYVKVTVLPTAFLEFKSNATDENERYDAAELDSILQVKLKDFPAIEPAIKRGMKVRSEFIVPVILKTN